MEAPLISSGLFLFSAGLFGCGRFFGWGFLGFFGARGVCVSFCGFLSGFFLWGFFFFGLGVKVFLGFGAYEEVT